MLFSTTVSSVSAESTLIQIENANAFATSADIQIGENLTIDQRSHWAMIHTSHSMRAIYCLEPGKPVSNGDIYDADTENYLNSVTNPTLTAEEICILLERVFQHGYTGNLDTVDAYYRYVATQLLMWEVLVGQRDMAFETADNGYAAVAEIFGKFISSFASGKAKSYYDSYADAIKSHAESLHFGYLTEAQAQENVLESDADGTYTFTDSAVSFSDFEVTVTNGEVIELTDTALKIQSNSGETALVTFTLARDSMSGFITLTADSRQTLAELCAGESIYYAAVKAAPIVTTETTTTATTTTTSTSKTTTTTKATTTSTAPKTTTTTKATTTSTTPTTTTTTTTSTTPATTTTTTTSEATTTSEITTTEPTTTSTSAVTTTGTGKTIPSVPKQDTPNTGDRRSDVLPIVLTGAGVVLIAGVLCFTRKVSSDDEKK
ncbi:MAG: thioester domain-containing protein [Ruminococcus sp.]